MKSPLRYPGGKSRAVKKLLPYFPSDLKKICSPFLGGGSIELALAERGVEVVASDSFQPLVNFWRVLLNDPKKLAGVALNYHPMSRKEFYSLRNDYAEITNLAWRAGAFYALNRSSFSGLAFSGGMSKNHPRFTRKGIESLADFRVDNFDVTLSDFELAIGKEWETFLYCDPPYLNGQRLYGHKGTLHADFDHDRLADVLSRRGNWILSYNDHPRVRELYKGHRIEKVQWNYGIANNSESNEILILNLN